MPMANRLLPRRRLVNGIQWECDLDEFLFVLHFTIRARGGCLKSRTFQIGAEMPLRFLRESLQLLHEPSPDQAHR